MSSLNHRQSTQHKHSRAAYSPTNLFGSGPLLTFKAGLPYVDTFVTSDGYLHNGLLYVKKKLPFVKTKLERFSPANA